jgi:CBS domain-containing protein
MGTIAELMSTDVRTVTATDLVGTVRDLMVEHAVHGVPVVGADGSVVGIMTSSDLVEGWDPAAGVETVMSECVVTTAPGTTVTEAARELLDRRIHHLVVVDNARVVGVVSSFDLLRALLEEPRTVGSGDAGPAPGAGRVRARVGDTVVIRSHTVGHERRGRITEVRGADGAPPYLVQWSDDPHDEPHEVLFFPGPDADVEPGEE